ncbi:MAG: RNA-directed DNA polymerase [Calditrichaeota bacterium]|nr:RNA-directed DNA polymerase [Calditrichota bacterium]MCB0295186.1 RNA-directed DNA polymerase [Calditrichota bacterium]MCB0305290.1 RNA-directed DNA polymerase [Calditrichota bacterium]MCB0311813.1 RNA-directed DNA polymerase [Calditrichota bacterium]
MKRPGYLIEKIAALDNLQLAYYKARKGKADRVEVLDYGQRLDGNLTDLQQQIVSGNVETGNYHYFTIYDPKMRTICAAPFGQRVLHHALMNVCHPYFEKAQIFESYATRPGKGTYAALDRARRFQRRYQWFLKLDFRKFFDSLDHAVIITQLHRLFKDRRLLHIFKKIIDSYQVAPCRGVPIGNLTSQYFANHYLAGMDHYIKETLRIPAYVRYMDDLVLWHDRKDFLIDAGLRIREFTEGQLKLTLKPFCLNRHTHGLPFLGYLLYPGQTRLAHRSRVRFIRKLRVYNDNLRSGVWSQEEYQQHISPLIAFTEYADAKQFRRTVMANI